MPRSLAFLLAAGVFGLTLIVLLLALNLLPSSTEAAERGTTAPLLVTWIMASITMLCGVALGGYLLANGLASGHRRSAAGVARVR